MKWAMILWGWVNERSSGASPFPTVLGYICHMEWPGMVWHSEGERRYEKHDFMNSNARI